MSLAPLFNAQKFIENHQQFADELNEAVAQADELIKGIEPFLERFLTPASAKWTRLDVAPYFDHITCKTNPCLGLLALHRLMIEKYDAQLQKLDGEGKIAPDTFALMTANNRAYLKLVEDHASKLEEVYDELGGHILKRFPEHRELSRALTRNRQSVTTDKTLIEKFRL